MIEDSIRRDKLCAAFLRRVTQRMRELGLNQASLAQRMDVSRPYITALLTRDKNFTFQTAAKLASALQMDFTPELCLQPQAQTSDYCGTVGWILRMAA